MLNDNDLYVILKLVSGEQVMAVIRAEDDDYIVVDHPMCIRMIPVLEQNKEHVTAYPLCQFTDDTEFVINKRNIMFVKRMHHVFIPHYQRIVAEAEDVSLITKNKDGSVKRAEDLDWGDEEEYLTPEEAEKRIEMLSALIGEEVEEEEDKFRVFVQGNDTIN